MSQEVTTPHPLVRQLRFTRAEFGRSLRGVTEEDARRLVSPMNCISWNVGHVAWQEQSYFLKSGQRQTPLPWVDTDYASGGLPSTPAVSDMLAAWETIERAADPWLDELTTSDLQRPFTRDDGEPGQRTFGSLLLRVIYHYWYHLGENMAIRQLLGHTRLPQFVGRIDEQAPYVPEDRSTLTLTR